MSSQKGAARALAMFDDPKAVGVLSEALYFNDYNVVKVAREALIRLLPSLKANNSDYRDCRSPSWLLDSGSYILLR